MGGLCTDPALLGQHPMRTWSATQSVVALSSAEAELYTIAEGASRALALQAMMREMGVPVNLVFATDSSASEGFASTRGLGHMRHLEVKDLWLQELVQSGRLSLVKVRSEENPADVLTKYQDRWTLCRLLALGGIEVVTVQVPDRAEGGVNPSGHKVFQCQLHLRAKSLVCSLINGVPNAMAFGSRRS